ncbi:hypothetical protein [Microvirga sp. CF3016]|uniref:hypothetical protein n=1 Tax=Microvirga sp. CF3016 TaxID=3110181 RepID=UPI002E7987AA|nr:hypothetical protein [Microvirga sp. CF3016]MEE1612062.1 hypothetical protein [Microvirga sp. CF3016]
MALRRSTNWSSAMRDLRNDRQQRASISFVCADGSFALSAIMREAVRRARQLVGSRLPWARRMAITLKGVWTIAMRAAAQAHGLLAA